MYTYNDNMTYEFTGVHFLANYCQCDTEKLNDIPRLSSVLESAIVASGATILGHIDHVFTPNGYTCVYVLSESHASIHTYPEQASCFVDLFTCGHQCSYQVFADVLDNYLTPNAKSYQVLQRDTGIVILDCKPRDIT
jgi:S-adenosylmethionine decarboxylase